MFQFNIDFVFLISLREKLHKSPGIGNLGDNKDAAIAQICKLEEIMDIATWRNIQFAANGQTIKKGSGRENGFIEDDQLTFQDENMVAIKVESCALILAPRHNLLSQSEAADT